MVGFVSACVTPYDGMIITEDTIFCEGEYYLPNGISISKGNINLGCNGATIIGNNIFTGIKVNPTFFHHPYNITVKNCNIENFETGIHVTAHGDVVLLNNKASNNGFGFILNGFYSHNNDSYVGNNNVLINNTASNNTKDGFYIYQSSNNVLSNNIATNNHFGFRFHRNYYNNMIFDNMILDNEYGAYLYDDPDGNSNNNTFWNNHFVDNMVNAYEGSTANDNNWNLSSIGNYWSDFKTNPEYPYYYEIYGSGNGIDWHPLGYILDEDNDGILDNEDKCPNTEGEQIVYGCSCNQILELKPGRDKSSNCSPGIIKVFTKGIGWAKDLF